MPSCFVCGSSCHPPLTGLPYCTGHQAIVISGGVFVIEIAGKSADGVIRTGNVLVLRRSTFSDYIPGHPLKESETAIYASKNEFNRVRVLLECEQ